MNLPDALTFMGIVFIGAGAWLIYPPASLVIVGVILFCGGIIGARGERGERK